MILKSMIRSLGPIPCVRVSSAQASGNAKKYAYWGATRYVIRLRKDGEPTLAACSRASSDRRSYRLAYRDALDIANQENRLFVSDRSPGPITDEDFISILENQSCV